MKGGLTEVVHGLWGSMNLVSTGDQWHRIVTWKWNSTVVYNVVREKMQVMWKCYIIPAFFMNTRTTLEAQPSRGVSQPHVLPFMIGMPSAFLQFYALRLEQAYVC
jgi:hypothetical protein